MSPKASPSPLPTRLLNLALATALAGFGTASWGAQPCVLDSVARLSAPSTNSANPAADALKLLQTSSGDDGQLVVSCNDKALAQLRLQLAPGEQRSLILVAQSGLTTPLDQLIQSAEGVASGQWEMRIEALSVDEQGSFQPANADGQGERIQLLRIDISANAANQPGQNQSWRIANTLLLVLEDPREERLFRDQFRIDPTLGQFSQRRPDSRSLQHQPAPAGVGSSQ
ncbi:MAG: hypothetical protein ACXIUM_00990 [Wenzhouxiangella sp.]